MATNQTSYVYVGLAGETAPGRGVKSGLYRMAVGDDKWELITRGLPGRPFREWRLSEDAITGGQEDFRPHSSALVYLFRW